MDLGSVSGIHELYARRQHEQLCAAAGLSGFLTVVLAADADAEKTIESIRREFARYLAADEVARKWLPADSCCEGRAPGHTGECWPIGGVHPAEVKSS